MIFAVINLQFAVISLQFAVIDLQFVVISLQFAVIDLQFVVIDLQIVGLLWNDLQPQYRTFKRVIFAMVNFVFLEMSKLVLE